MNNTNTEIQPNFEIEKVDCMICLEELDFTKNNEYIRLKCHDSHIFHNKCLLTWCKKKINCPICKKFIL